METLRLIGKYLVSGVVLIVLIALSPILVPIVLWFAITHGSAAGEAQPTVE